jgi:hypothetical protein
MKILENGFELMSNAHHTNLHIAEIAALTRINQNLTKAVASQKLVRNVFIAIAVGVAPRKKLGYRTPYEVF